MLGIVICVKCDIIEWIGLVISRIVGLLSIFWCCVFLISECCSFLVIFGFSNMLFLEFCLVFCMLFSKICFNFGLSVIIGSFGLSLIMFCMIVWDNVM